MYFLQEKFFGLVMSVFSAMIFFLEIFYAQNLNVKPMSDRELLLFYTTSIVGILVVVVCTKLENINYYKINAIKKSL